VGVCKEYDSIGVREMRARDVVPAAEEIKRAARHHGSDFEKRITFEFPMCQLLF
jgi:hypothetical protein